MFEPLISIQDKVHVAPPLFFISMSPVVLKIYLSLLVALDFVPIFVVVILIFWNISIVGIQEL